MDSNAHPIVPQDPPFEDNTKQHFAYLHNNIDSIKQSPFLGEIKTVKPDDVAKIGITKGKQLCTLVTCTPYGVNSDRLVVFAELTGSRRVANDTGGTGGYSYTLPFSRKGGPTIEEILALAGVLLLITAIAIEIYRLIKRRKTIE